MPSRCYRRIAALLGFLIFSDFVFVIALLWQGWHELHFARLRAVYHSPLGAIGDWMLPMVIREAREPHLVRLLMLHLVACCAWLLRVTLHEWQRLKEKSTLD